MLRAVRRSTPLKAVRSRAIITSALACWAAFTIYASLVDLNRMVACVDGKLPIESDVPLMPIFRGDTVFILGRVATPELTVRSQLSSFTVNGAGCKWLPIRSVK